MTIKDNHEGEKIGVDDSNEGEMEKGEPEIRRVVASVNKEVISQFWGCLIGTTKGLVDMLRLREALSKSGIQGIEMKRLSRMHVLIKFKNEEVEIHGAPIHAWNLVTFQRVAEMWGSFVSLSSNKHNDNDSDCSVMRLLILTDRLKRTEETLKLNCGEESFPIRKRIDERSQGYRDDGSSFENAFNEVDWEMGNVVKNRVVLSAERNYIGPEDNDREPSSSGVPLSPSFRSSANTNPNREALFDDR
ncbi:hypothetical protein Gotri_022177 [Gossypium trilobum]|uniref:DUF4283 domain-containing protein n=1 Tax=Gossypium trilobum TaxID=34281 RepID=A0A7J9DFC3_9ROSI|nr:hypothetical protein [Gossypium trilobum]